MVIVTHIFFSAKYKDGREPFHQEQMNEKFIPKKGNNVTYDESVFNIKFSKNISLEFLVVNVNYRYVRNEINELITFIDVILKSK